MALTSEDLESIREVVNDSEMRLTARMVATEERLTETVKVSAREVIEEITEVINEGHDMIGGEFDKVEQRFGVVERKLDTVQRAWQ